MIPRQRIVRVADRDGVPAATVERDYVLAHVVGALAESAGADALVFKGGTALRLCYFEPYRYFADLDLCAVGVTIPEARAVLAGALERGRDSIGFEDLELTDDAPPRIRYLGPLGRVRHIKLDVDADELVFASERVPLIRRYDDVGETSGLVTYALAEIAAEKLRCVVQRLQCRDMYDLHALFQDAGVDVVSAWEMFTAKARRKDLDPDRFFVRFDDRAPAYKARWDEELTVHLGSGVPDFDSTLRQLRRRLRPLR